MDHQAAKEYSIFLWKRVGKPLPLFGRAWWIPSLGFMFFWALGSWPGLFLGLLIGWAICAILVNLDEIKRELYIVELMRHTHEYTDEAEAGRLVAKIDADVSRQAKRGLKLW